QDHGGPGPHRVPGRGEVELGLQRKARQRLEPRAFPSGSRTYPVMALPRDSVTAAGPGSPLRRRPPRLGPTRRPGSADDGRLRVECEGPIALLTFDRPDARNVLFDPRLPRRGARLSREAKAGLAGSVRPRLVR